MTETYELSWTPSDSSKATSQDVFASTNGGEFANIFAGANVTVTSFQFDFTTDASIAWFVRTSNAAGDKIDSDAFTFTASDQSALTPATGLSVKWISHNP